MTCPSVAGVKIAIVKDKAVVSYLKPSNRPENYPNLSYDMKNKIDQNVEMGGWVRENFDLPPHIEPEDILTRKIEIATMVSGKYFDDRELKSTDNRTIGFKYEKDEKGELHIHFNRLLKKAA